MSAKTDLINDVVMKLYADFGDDKSKQLEQTLFMVLSGYDVEKKSTDIIPYEEDITENLINRFCLAKKLHNLSNKTIAYYRKQCLVAFEKIGKNPLETTSDDLRLHYLKRQEIDKISDVTNNNERRAMMSFYSWMQAEEIRLNNPMLKVGVVKTKKKKKEAFTEYELELMRSRLTDAKQKAIFEFLISTFARVSEVAQVRIDEIEGDQVLVHGKGDKDRYVFLNPRARVALDDYLAEREDNNPYLFPKKIDCIGRVKQDWWKNAKYVNDTEHASTNGIECFIDKLGKNNGIKAYPHKFRRTGATMALKKGMSLIMVSKLLGHENVNTTQTYLDINHDDMKQAHEKYC